MMEMQLFIILLAIVLYAAIFCYIGGNIVNLLTKIERNTRK